MRSEALAIKRNEGGGVANAKHGAFSDSHGKISKVDRYKWSDPKTPGVMMFIPKEVLNVDRDTYQRDVDQHKVTRIASKFSWPAFGVITCALRSDGSYWIVDGQHRWGGAMKRSDVKEVPCIVFESTGIVDEAQTFIDTNSLRRAVSAVGKFRAQLVTEDDNALFVEKLVAMSGRKVGFTGPTGVACVRLLYNLAEKHRSVLERVWPMITRASEGHPLHQEVVDAIVHIEINLPEGVSLTDPRWCRRVVDTGALELLGAARKAASFYAKGGARIWAEGVLNRLNKSIPEGRRLEMVKRG